MSNDNDVNLDDPELQALAEGLNADIGLSKSSDDAFKDALNRHGKDGKHRRDPGFLWKVAADMQERLAQDEKDKMFAWMDANSVAFLHAPEKKDHRGPKGDKGGVDIRLMMTILDSDQQEALKNIMDSYRAKMEEVMSAMKDGTKDESAGKAELEALELAMKNEIDSLLTDEQKDRIDRLQSDMKQKIDDAFQAEHDAMVTALGMTADQEASLAQINQNHQEAVKALFAEIKNAGDRADKSDFEDRMKELIESILNILPQNTKEIKDDVKDNLKIFLRGYLDQRSGVYEISFRDSEVESIRNQLGISEDLIKLEPTVIGGMYPSHMEDRVLLNWPQVPQNRRN